MNDWRSDLRSFARELGGQARRVARAVDHAVDRDPYHIVGYRGYGTRWRALALGRVLQDEGIVPPDVSHGAWQNLMNTLRRLESDPMPHARMRAAIAESSHDVVADDEGFVRDWLKVPGPLAEGSWHELTLTLDLPGGEQQIHSTSRVLVPSPAAAFGVISDMDDTVLQSDVTTFVRAARLLLLENARTRLPFPGVAAFYRALHQGVAGCATTNPIFYVSSSPWNLYDVIADFLEARDIPAGPLLLRDWDLMSSLSGHAGHKSTLIREIMDAYPWMRFILVGDSAQEDPEIYAALVREYPGRIMAIYIRDVSHSASRSASIAALAEQVAAAQSALVLASDTLTVARHAADHGWIDVARLTEIGAETQEEPAS